MPYPKCFISKRETLRKRDVTDSLIILVRTCLCRDLPWL